MSNYIKIKDEYFKKSKIVSVEYKPIEGIFGTLYYTLYIVYAQPYKYENGHGTVVSYKFTYMEHNLAQQDVLKLKNCNAYCTFNQATQQNT